MPFEGEKFEKPLEIKKEETKGEFGEREIERFLEAQQMKSCLWAEKEPSEEDLRNLLALEREHTDSNVLRQKQIRELVGPEFPSTSEISCARSSEKYEELWEKYETEKKLFGEKFEKLTPEERKKKGVQAMELKDLLNQVWEIELSPGIKRPDWFKEEMKKVEEERFQKEGEELWYLSPLKYKRYLSQFHHKWISKLEGKGEK